MIKLLIAGRRASGRTRRGALDHLRNIHAKMVVCPPSGAGAMPLDYVQNHVIDGAYPSEGAYAIERDLITELWFESADHLRAATSTPYYLERLRPDEPQFVDDHSVAKMMVGVELLREGERGRFKAFLFMSGESDLGSIFAGLPGLGAVVRNTVLLPPTGHAPFVETIFEGWFARAEDAMAALERLAGDAVSGRGGFAVAAEEYDTERLRGDLHSAS